ncbi:hypothetical protein A5906_09505 [Bradyrhizobium sacchari]|nr:hypothetical protein A5906_09505 [Bradyrhizobium sacchari]
MLLTRKYTLFADRDHGPAQDAAHFDPLLILVQQAMTAAWTYLDWFGGSQVKLKGLPSRRLLAHRKTSRLSTPRDLAARSSSSEKTTLWSGLGAKG